MSGLENSTDSWSTPDQLIHQLAELQLKEIGFSLLTTL
jgi:hypothetical protein